MYIYLTPADIAKLEAEVKPGLVEQAWHQTENDDLALALMLGAAQANPEGWPLVVEVDESAEVDGSAEQDQ